MNDSAFDRFCISSYLAFRYVVCENAAWREGLRPHFPRMDRRLLVRVADASAILASLRSIMEEVCASVEVGILLSSGIDSGILAALMRPGSEAFTIRFIADDAVDETAGAARYADRSGLNLHVVDVTWDDYLDLMPSLFHRKNSPLHPVEVGLYKAASLAASRGIHRLVVGNGADSTFGGMDKLLSRDWRVNDFAERYTFVEPRAVVREPVEMISVYEQYATDGRMDVMKFLKVLHGNGIIQAFENAIGAAGCETIEPYESLALDGPLDLERVRRGQTKYLLREVFGRLYGDSEIPRKIPFARPMDRWMEHWTGPRRPEFRKDLEISQFTGEQKYLMFCLEYFMDCFDGVCA
jgi:hypothetical protein